MTTPIRWLPWLAGALALGTVCAGLLLDARGTALGVPHPPFVARWDPRLHPLVGLAVPLFAAAVALGPALLSARLSPARFALAGFALTLALRLALAAGRGGTGAWERVFDLTRSREAANEYLAGLPALRYGTGFLLDRFAELVPALPVHVAGHPPGLLLAIDLLGLDTPARLAAVCIAAGALSVPLTYAVGRRLLDERAARVAALLVAFAPGALQYGATSADALFLALGLLAAWPLAAGHRVAGAAALAAASLFAWSLPAVGAWAGVLALRRDGARAALELAAACGGAVLLVYAALAGLTGFDPLGTLDATARVYELGIAGSRPYTYWVLGSPVAFLLALGLPVAWLAVRSLADRRDLAVAIFAVLLVAAAVGFTKGETERIWLFLAPFVCLAAAPRLRERDLTPVLALLAAQALVTEALFGSPW
jgi:hypothetical protein